MQRCGSDGEKKEVDESGGWIRVREKEEKIQKKAKKEEKKTKNLAP